MKPWSHLANAPLIDWVIESLKCNPELWAAALNAALRAVRDGILNAAWNVARNEVRIAARIAAWNATDDATRNAARVAARDAAHGAILALIAYDDCRQYLHMSYEQLLTYAVLSERPQAVLLLSLKWIQEHETLVTSR